MGAEIQFKRDSNGYGSVWGIHKDAKSDIWSLYQENKPQKNGQCPESLLPWPLKLDGTLEYDKEKVKQTILKHESTFRHQLQELHRLYGKQKELMNVFKRSNVQPVRIQEEAYSLSHFPSQISFEDPKRWWHGSDVPSMKLVFGQTSQSGSSSQQSFPGVSKANNMVPFTSRDYGSSETREPPSSKGTPSQREIIDLESPAEACMQSEATYSLEKCCELPRIASNSTTCTKDILLSKGVKTSDFNALNDHHNGDVTRSLSPLRRKNELADLNEPILLDDSSDSDSADNPTRLSGSWGDKKSEDKSATPDSVLNPLWKNKSPSAKGNNIGGTSFKNLQSMNEMDRKEPLAYDLNSKVLQPEITFMSRDVYSRDSSVAFQSYNKKELEKLKEMPTSGQVRIGQATKRKLFGVDIFENDQSLVIGTTTEHHADKIVKFGCMQSFIDVKSGVNSSSRSFQSSIHEVSYQNDLSPCSPLNSKRSEGILSQNCHPITNTTNSDFVAREPIYRDRSEHVESKQAKVPRVAMETSNFFQDVFPAEYNILPADCQRKQKFLEVLSVHSREIIDGAEQPRANKNYDHLHLNSSQNCSQQFFKNRSSLSSEKLGQKPEKVSPVLVHVHNNIEGQLPSSTIIIKDSSSSHEQRVSRDQDLPFKSSELKNNTADALREGSLSGHDPAGKRLSLAKPINIIDLNVTLTEEESPSSPCLPTVKLTVTEVDLEVPTVPESEADKQIDLLAGGPEEPCEEFMRLAAEAIVAISMSVGEDSVDDATPESVQERPDDCLQWFVDVVSSHKCHDQNNTNDVNWKGNDDFIVELIPDGMDEFEYMTLKQEDVKVDDCYPNHTAPVLENQEDEDTKVASLSRRPRRGQRGRQRKDFQRDVLPSIISLSKLEVTEDIQTFEELLKATGFTWQSSLSRRGAGKSSRGRRRSGAIPATQIRETVCSPLEQKPVSKEVQGADKTLICWGKRTRRLPRQRSVNGTTAII